MKKIPTEIYSRIVGYFRPISQWNPGKKAEFEDRLTYNVENTQIYPPQEREIIKEDI
jgi:glucan biosynthesis protein